MKIKIKKMLIEILQIEIKFPFGKIRKIYIPVKYEVKNIKDKERRNET